MNYKWFRLILITSAVLIFFTAAAMAGENIFPVLDTYVQEEKVAMEQEVVAIPEYELEEKTNGQEPDPNLPEKENEIAEPGNDFNEENDNNTIAEVAEEDNNEVDSIDEKVNIEEKVTEKKDDEAQEIADTDNSNVTSVDVVVKAAINKTVNWYKANRNLPGQEGWEAYVALWGAGEALTDTSIWRFDQYWRNEGPGNLDPGHPGNEHIRYGFMLLSVGQDPTNVWGGRNLLAELAAQQQENGSFGQLGRHIWAMELLNIGMKMGLNVGNWADQNARQEAINWLLSVQNENGSFGQFSELDFTGWALVTLSSYRSYGGVNNAINDAVNYLQNRQKHDPSTAAFSGGEWTDFNANSQAAVISGLIALGEDLTSANSRWVQNGETLIDVQLKFQHENGYFVWRKDNPGDIDMATSQSLIALLDILHGKHTRHRMAGELSFN